MSFFLLIIVSLSTSGLLFWIGKGWLSLIPLSFLLLYSGDYITQFSFGKIGGKITYQHGALVSRMCIMVGIILLGHSQGVIRYHTSGALVICNSILLGVSYYNQYKEGMSIFPWGIILSRLLLMGTGAYHHISIDNILLIGNGASIELLVIWHIIIQQEKNQEEYYRKALLNREIRSYISLYGLFFQLFGTTIVSCVLQIRCSTFFIALRQHFLSYKKEASHEKKESLTGRALLQGQKILTRYENKKSHTYSFLNQLLQRGIVPSYEGLQFLQVAQGIQILLLIMVSIRQLHSGIHMTLIWYRLGVACFVISLFGIDRQDQLLGRYKKMAIIVINGALYITVFSETTSWSTITIRSLARNCSNMFLCLFYDTIIPEEKRILKRSDLLFRMLRTNITVIITLLSLFKIQLHGDTIFALGCIIIGGIGFLSYHIWKKYSSI